MPRILPFIPPRKRRAFGLGAIDQNALASGYGDEWLFLRPDVFNQVLAHGFPGDVYGGSDGVLIPESDLQIALANAVMFSSPEAIILFGGLTKAGELILKPTRESMETNLIKVFQNKVKILVSHLKESDAAILGASALAWEMP